MSRSRLVIIAIAAVLLASPAQAQFDHPDLMDQRGLYAVNAYPPSGYYRKYLYADIDAYQRIFASGGKKYNTTYYTPGTSSRAHVNSALYEPDNIKRKAGKNTLKQNAWVRVQISGYQAPYGSFQYGPKIFKSCKGKGTWTAPGVGKYMTKCGSTTFADLELPQRVIDHIEEFLGLKKLKFTVTIP